MEHFLAPSPINPSNKFNENILWTTLRYFGFSVCILQYLHTLIFLSIITGSFHELDIIIEAFFFDKYIIGIGKKWPKNKKEPSLCPWLFFFFVKYPAEHALKWKGAQARILIDNRIILIKLVQIK